MLIRSKALAGVPGKTPLALVLIVCLMSVMAAVAERAHMSAFTASETDTTLEPGRYTFPDGNLHIRDGLSQYTWTGATDQRLNGTGQFTVNGNMGKDLTGPMWGMFHADRANGTLDGVWNGYFDLARGSGRTHIAGHGGGGLADVQFEADCVYSGPTALMPAVCTGRILDTK